MAPNKADKATVVIGKELHAELRAWSGNSKTPALTIRDIVTDACREWLKLHKRNGGRK
jgi:hypothetical protein